MTTHAFNGLAGVRPATPPPSDAERPGPDAGGDAPARRGWHGLGFLLELIARSGARRIAVVGPSGSPAPAVYESAAGLAPGAMERVDADGADEFFWTTARGWDLVLVDAWGVERGRAQSAARAASGRASYVLVDAPAGVRPAGDPGPDDAWERRDGAGLPVLRRGLFPGTAPGVRAGLVLACSHNDPMALRVPGPEALDDAGEVDVTVDRLPDDLDRALALVEEQAFELGYAKNYSTYRWAQRLRATPVWNAARWLQNRNERVVALRVLGERNPASAGGAGAASALLVRACANQGARAVPWDFVELGRGWTPRHDAAFPYGRGFAGGAGASARVPVDRDPELEFLGGPGGGVVEVSFRGRIERVDLYAPEETPVRVYPARTPMVERGPAPEVGFTDAGAAPAPSGPARFTPEERATIEALRGARAVAVHVPRWLGITQSTRALFEHTYALPVTSEQEPYRFSVSLIEHHARVLLEAGVRHVVFSGGDEMHFRLMERLHELDPGVRFDMLWHASYVQYLEDYNWSCLRLWLDAARAGLVHTVGTVKKGMEAFFRAAGVRSAFVMNLVQGPVLDPPQIPGDERHVGMWVSNPSYRKISHAMLSALAMTPRVRLHAAGLDRRSREVVDYFAIPAGEVRPRPVPHDELLAAIRRTHLSLYVTFSECCPMLPLESMAQGVPCLTGPNSHLFEDDPWLFERLVVAFPDRADVIARMLERAIDERGEIVRRYAGYLPGYNERARASVQAFLAG